MNIACILAAGSGTRFHNANNIPKQFVEICNQPIVIYTIEKFINHPQIDKVLVVCHDEWISYLMNFPCMKNPKVFVTTGGENRNLSLQCALNYMQEHFTMNDEDIILTHDGVRMFVTNKIIDDNILATKKFNGIGTYVPTNDTIAIIDDCYVTNIPKRDSLMNAQTPQTFKYNLLKQIFTNSIEDTSDLCALVMSKTKTKIGIVKGSYQNFKITNEYDFLLASELIKSSKFEK